MRTLVSGLIAIGATATVIAGAAARAEALTPLLLVCGGQQATVRRPPVRRRRRREHDRQLLGIAAAQAGSGRSPARP